jgi:hypothetical protein
VETGAPGEIRTPDLQLRRLPLYPAELRARAEPLEFTTSARGHQTRPGVIRTEGILLHPGACGWGGTGLEPARSSEAVERDPQKLMELVEEINHLLEEKERRLAITPPKP